MNDTFSVKRGPGRPRKNPALEEPPGVLVADSVMSESDMLKSANLSLPSLRNLQNDDPEFPKVFSLYGKKVVLTSEWNAYLYKVRERGYQPRSTIGNLRNVKMRTPETTA